MIKYLIIAIFLCLSLSGCQDKGELPSPSLIQEATLINSVIATYPTGKLTVQHIEDYIKKTTNEYAMDYKGW